MEKGEFNSEKITILEFKVVNGSIYAPFDFDENHIDNYNTNMEFSSSFSAEGNLVKANMKFDIDTKSTEKQEEANVKFHFVYMFNVENLTDIFESNESVEARKLITHIAAISFSTSRGVLITRLQGTVLSEYILPIIDPRKLVNEWIESMIETENKKIKKAK